MFLLNFEEFNTVEKFGVGAIDRPIQFSAFSI